MDVTPCPPVSGFDQQIDSARTLADATIGRLPGINSTIQKAVRDNTEASSILQDVSTDYNDALRNNNQLEILVDRLEVTSCSRHIHHASLRLNSGADTILSSREPPTLCWAILLCRRMAPP